jgi:hypothetical protein
MGHDAHERAERLPREADAMGSVELLGEPGCGLFVPLGARVNSATAGARSPRVRSLLEVLANNLE